MRWFIAEVFKKNYHKVSRIEKLDKIAIIGGYESDLEVQAILHANPLASIKYFGIDSDPEIEYLDLNTVDVTLLNEEFDRAHLELNKFLSSVEQIDEERRLPLDILPIFQHCPRQPRVLFSGLYPRILSQ